MPFDGFFARAAAFSLQKCVGARIERIHHNTKECVEFSIYYNQTRETLLISASPADARICLQSGEPQRTAVPTMLCMVFRKYLQNARITAIEAVRNERIIRLDFDSYNDLGHVQKIIFFVELMGKRSNLLLCDENQRLLAALHTTDITSMTRRIFIGGQYETPPPQDKKDALCENRSDFITKSQKNPTQKCADFLLSSYLALSPLVCREIVFRAAGSCDCLLCGVDPELLWNSFSSVMRMIDHNEYNFCLVTDKEYKNIEYSFINIGQYGDKYITKAFPSASELLNAFYNQIHEENQKKQFSTDIMSILTNAKARAVKKLVNQSQELSDCAMSEEYKKIGDLITSNIYLIKQGTKSVTLYDYETETDITVELDSRLSPAKNAQRYYKKYTKAKNAAKVLKSQIEIGEQFIEYLGSVFDSLSRAVTEKDFADIRTELVSVGIIQSKKTDNKNAKKNKSQIREQTKPLLFDLPGGLQVKIGKNNLQNDALSFGSEKNDIWFHTKGYAGSHCVLLTNGAEPSDEDYTLTAMLAAYHSKARGAAMVPVDYTRIKNLKKPPNAKPGFVTFDKYFTAYVVAEMPAGIVEVKA